MLFWSPDAAVPESNLKTAAGAVLQESVQKLGASLRRCLPRQRFRQELHSPSPCDRLRREARPTKILALSRFLRKSFEPTCHRMSAIAILRQLREPSCFPSFLFLYRRVTGHVPSQYSLVRLGRLPGMLENQGNFGNRAVRRERLAVPSSLREAASQGCGILSRNPSGSDSRPR